MSFISLALSVVAAITAGAAAYTSWRARQWNRELAGRYADAVALVVLVARADPPVADPAVVAACERMITAHHIEATVTSTRNTVH